MKNYISKNANSAAVFSIVFFIAHLFLTLDIYSKNQVTPETPLLNIAGLPFLRMDFLLIGFSLAYLIGMVVAKIFKKSAEMLLKFSLGIAGILVLFIALFDVNTMQLFSPVLRISHVIMTVSRVDAIVAVVSGLFAGAACTVLSRFRVDYKIVLLSVLSAVVVSCLANSENLHMATYCISGAMLLLSALVKDFSQPCQAEKTLSKCSAVTSILGFVSTTALAVTVATLYHMLCDNAGFGQIGYTAVTGILVCVFAAVLSKTYHKVLTPLAFLAGSIISYILIHYASEVITYSNNRVIYVMPYAIWIVAAVIAAVFSITAVLKKKEI